MVGALTQHNGHAKSKITAIFRKGAMRVFAATTPSLILCRHPFLQLDLYQRLQEDKNKDRQRRCDPRG